jgi:hypothetical protein
MEIVALVAMYSLTNFFNNVFNPGKGLSRRYAGWLDLKLYPVASTMMAWQDREALLRLLVDHRRQRGQDGRHRGPLHVQRYAMSGEDRLMHDLGQSGVREDAVDQIHSRGAKGHGYNEPLNQFRDFRSDQLRSEQSIGICVK